MRLQDPKKTVGFVTEARPFARKGQWRAESLEPPAYTLHDVRLNTCYGEGRESLFGVRRSIAAQTVHSPCAAVATWAGAG